jgi:tRNA-dihydrouridine synthase
MRELDRVDGVMMGRAAYQKPWRHLEVDSGDLVDAAMKLLA